MESAVSPHCAMCRHKNCREGKDCYDNAADHLALYEDDQIVQLHRAASAVEARHYCKEPRVREVMLFAAEMGFTKIGLAFCVGLAEEARIIEEIFAQQFEVISACCKNCGVPKSTLGLEQIDPQAEHESMCNPAGQADMLDAAGVELIVICGLCVGHDAIVSMRAKAPVTTLIVKDRVLGHNPVAAVYCQYLRRRMKT
jgi:uncharacterized metal-binding protein